MKGLQRSIARGPRATKNINTLRLSISALALSFTGSTGVAVFDTAVLSGLPEGNLLLLGSVANLTFSGSGADANLVDTFNGDFSLGTTPADDNTLSAADVDIVASTAMAAAVAEVSGPNRAANAAQAIIDNTDGAAELNLNVLLDADQVTNAETSVVTVDGTVDIAYIVLGDD